ncbi:MAG: TetR family transcriptional regulator [Deltaproteobacteria bacterium]|nr:TetR family transcriptional regulator [Deltaproteobacteria bacterium]
MDAKSRILNAGVKIVLQKGFYDTGLAELLEAAQVPKGSFYFYFKNKEDFGLQLIDYFADNLKTGIEKVYKNESIPHIERVRRVFKEQAESFRKNDFKGGCPIGNLSLEMGDRNVKFRKKLNQVFENMKKNLSALLEKAQKGREISESIDVHDTADFVISSWEGVLMKMKVSKSAHPHEVFDRMIFELLLKPA